MATWLRFRESGDNEILHSIIDPTYIPRENETITILRGKFKVIEVNYDYLPLNRFEISCFVSQISL